MRYIHFPEQIVKHDWSGQAVVTNHVHIRRTMHVAELYIITKGKLFMHQGEDFVSNAGEGAIILPNEEHYGNSPSKFTMHWAHFFLPEDRIVNESPVGPEGYITLPVRFKLPRIDSAILLTNILESYRMTADTQYARNAYLTALITEIANQFHSERINNDYGKRLNSIISYIRSNIGVDYNHKINLDTKSIANEFGYSEKYIYELFKKNIRVTPHNFIVACKMNGAAERLLNTNDTIASIADRFGYTTPQHFMKSFKAHFGLTPSEYRNRHITTTELFYDDEHK